MAIPKGVWICGDFAKGSMALQLMWLSSDCNEESVALQYRNNCYILLRGNFRTRDRLQCLKFQAHILLPIIPHARAGPTPLSVF